MKPFEGIATNLLTIYWNPKNSRKASRLWYLEHGQLTPDMTKKMLSPVISGLGDKMSAKCSMTAPITCHRPMGRDTSQNLVIGQHSPPMAGEVIDSYEALKTGSAENAEDLLNNALTSNPLCCQTDRQAEHGNSAIQLFRKDLCGIRSVGHKKRSLSCKCKEI